MSGSRPSPRFWASSPHDLVDTTKCPACFTPLRSTVCTRCGLDVRTEGAAELFAASQATVGWEDRRQQLIAEMRERQRHAVQARTKDVEDIGVPVPATGSHSASTTTGTPAPGTPAAPEPANPAGPPEVAPWSAPDGSARTGAPAPVHPAIPASAPVHPAIPASAPVHPATPAAASVPSPASAPSPDSVIPTAMTPPPGAGGSSVAAPRAPRRRPTVQAVLLTTGVIAVSVTAIFFLLVAYVLASLEVRSAIIAAASALVIAVAIVLHRRGLKTTAEGISSLAIVLLLLDIWIIRANDLFGAGGVDPLLFGGAGTLVVAAIGLLTRRAAPLRATSLFAAAALPLGAALVVAGAVSLGGSDEVSATRLWAAGAAAAAVGLVARSRFSGALEKGFLIGATVAGGMLAAVFAWFALPENAFLRLVTFAVVAALWLCELVASGSPVPEALRSARRRAAAAGVGYAAAAAAVGALAVGDDAVLSITAVAPVGAAIVGAGVLAGAALTVGSRPLARWATVSALVVAAPSLLSALLNGTSATVAAIGAPLVTRLFDSSPRSGRVDADLAFALIGLSLVAVIVAIQRRRRRWAVTAIELCSWTVLLLGAGVGPVVAASAAAAVAALCAASLVTVAAQRRWLRSALQPLGLVAVAFLLAAGLQDAAVWPWAVGAALLASLGAAVLDRVAGERAALSALALSVAVVAGAVFPIWAHADVSVFLLPAFLASAALLAIAITRRLAATDASALAITAGLVLLVSGPLAVLAGADRAQLIGLCLTCAAALASVFAMILRSRPSRPVETIVAAVVGPLAITGAALFAASQLGGPLALSIGFGAGGLIAATAGALLVPAPATARTIWDSSVTAGIAGTTLALALAGDPERVWLTLLLISLAFTVMAFSSGGPFVRSPRRLIGWAALGFATAALWQTLSRGGDERISAYTLPLAGALLLTASIPALRAPRSPSRTRLTIAIAAVALAVLPSTVAHADDLVAYGALLGVGVLAGAARVRALRPLIPDIVALAGAASLLAVAAGAAALLLPAGPLDPELSRLIVFAAAALAGLLWLLPTPAGSLPRVLAAGALPLLLAGLAATSSMFAVTLSTGEDAHGWAGDAAGIWGAVVSVVAAAGLVALPRSRSAASSATGRRLRAAWRSGTAAAVLLAAASAAAYGRDSTWLVLLLAAVAFGLLSASEGDPFRSRTGVRHLGWVAVFLATTGLWWSLVRGAVTDVEPYTLPVAALLLAVLVLLLVRSRGNGGIGRSALLVGGLALALAPTAVVAFSSGGVRAVVVTATAALLTVATPFLPDRVAGVALRASLGAIAGPILLGVTAGRALDGAVHLGGPAVEGWLLAGVVPSLLAAAAWTTRVRIPHWPATAAVLAAAAEVVLVESTTMTEGHAVVVRLLGTLCALAAGFIALAAADGARIGRSVRYGLLAALALVTAVGITLTDALGSIIDLPGAGSVPAVELATGPTALALIVGGILLLDRTPSLSSWRTVGPGLVLALLPSLLHDLAPTELWRAVALGAVSFAAIVLGFVTRRAAPLLLGAVAFTIHAVAQLWPWISDVYGAVPWWLWIGVGGVVLIVIAARYEQRVKNLKDAVLYVGSLR